MGRNARWRALQPNCRPAAALARAWEGRGGATRAPRAQQPAHRPPRRTSPTAPASARRRRARLSRPPPPALPLPARRRCWPAEPAQLASRPAGWPRQIRRPRFHAALAHRCAARGRHARSPLLAASHRRRHGGEDGVDAPGQPVRVQPRRPALLPLHHRGHGAPLLLPGAWCLPLLANAAAACRLPPAACPPACCRLLLPAMPPPARPPAGPRRAHCHAPPARRLWARSRAARWTWMCWRARAWT